MLFRRREDQYLQVFQIGLVFRDTVPSEPPCLTYARVNDSFIAAQRVE